MLSGAAESLAAPCACLVEPPPPKLQMRVGPLSFEAPICFAARYLLMILLPPERSSATSSPRWLKTTSNAGEITPSGSMRY